MDPPLAKRVKLTAAQRDRARKAVERSAAASAGAPCPLFSCRCSDSGRPALPLELVHLIVDRLPVRDVVQSIAAISVGAYHTVREYADTVQRRATAAAAVVVEATAASDCRQFAPSRLSVGLFSCSRSDACSFSSSAGVADLLRSRLRGMVSGIVLPVRTNDSQCYPRSLDVTLVAQVAHALPGLQLLQCGLSALTDGLGPDQLAITLPSRLCSLALHMIPFHGRNSFPGVPHSTAASLQSAGWAQSQASCLTFSVAVAEAVAKLPFLTHLAFEPIRSPTPLPAAFIPFAAAPLLRSLVGGDWSKDVLCAIRSLPHLTTWRHGLAFPSNEESGIVELLRAPQTQRFTSLALQYCSFMPAMREPFLHLHGSLTQLTPPSWRIDDLMWLTQFPLLQSLRFADEACAGLMVSPQLSLPPITPLRCVLSLLTDRSMAMQLHSLSLQYHDCTDAHLEMVLQSLRRLHTLRLESDAITRLEPLRRSSSASTLRSLHITLPAVPPADAQHLCSMRQLTSLNIAGSFNAPLTLQQLLAFVPPYPRRSLQWLRSFTPRSDREPALLAAAASVVSRASAGPCLTSSLPPVLLSHALQFLSLNDFFGCARSCRGARSAASLPSAWGFTAGIDPSVPAAAASLASRVSLAHPLAESPLSACGRQLILPMGKQGGQVFGRGASSIECASQLPLCRHAPWLSLQHRGQQWSHATQLAAMHALSDSMPRLRGLDVDHLVSLYAEAPGVPHAARASELDSLFERLGPRLLRASLIECLPQHLLPLRNLVDLCLSTLKIDKRTPAYSQPFVDALAGMHSLRRLMMQVPSCTQIIVAAIHVLSVQHALREVRLELSGPTDSAELALLQATLCGQSVESAHARRAVSPLEALIVVFTSPAGEGHPRELESLFQWPRLRRLAICAAVRSTAVWNPEDALNTATAPLESLQLVAELDCTALPGIARFSRLHELLLASPALTMPAASEGILGPWPTAQLPAACLQQWTAALPQLRVLSLDNVQLHSSTDLHLLPRWPHLHSLALSRQRSLRMEELTAVLPRLTALQSLLLADNHNVHLCTRDWMQERGRPTSQEQSSAFASAAAPVHSPRSAASAGLLTALHQCRSLRWLSWSPEQSVVAVSAAYTSAHSWIPAKLRAHCLPHFARNEAAREREALRRFVCEINAAAATAPQPSCAPGLLQLLQAEVAVPQPQRLKLEAEFVPLHVSPLSTAESFAASYSDDPYSNSLWTVTPLSLARADAMRMETERLEEEAWRQQQQQQQQHSH